MSLGIAIVVLLALVANFVWLGRLQVRLQDWMAAFEKKATARSINLATGPHPDKTRTPQPLPPTRSEAPTPTPKTGTVSRQLIHDLNNHLGTIAGFTDAALEDISEKAPVYKDLEEIQEAARKAKAVAKEISESTKQRHATSTAAGPPETIKTTPRQPQTIEPKGPPRQASLSTVSVLTESPRASSVPPMVADTDALSAHFDLASKPVSTLIPTADIPTGTEHLLIVDDEAQLLRMFRRFFEPLGYKVTTFSDSLEARDIFEQNHAAFDLAIIDQRMPDLSGANLAMEMLSVRPNMPIILLSGYTDKISPQDAAKIGIRRFLSKPIPQVELNETIRSVLDEQPRYNV